MTTDVAARTALSGVVMVPVERCPGCQRPLGLDDDETYRGTTSAATCHPGASGGPRHGGPFR